MNPELPVEAVELRAAAARAFADHGGGELARRAEADPNLRSTEVAPLLASLGADDLDPRSDDISLVAAAALCEAAGAAALPYPLAASLVRDADGRPIAAVPPGTVRIDHGDLFDAWRVGTLDGASGGVAGAAGTPLGTRLGPFVADLSAPTGDAAPLVDLLLQQTLVAWTVLGGLDRAVALATEHVTGRIQFGKPLSAFQAVQFQIADAAVGVAGLRELAGFTLWRVGTVGAEARADVLALRLHTLETARAVLRTTQQLHGAAGVCDEYDVSVLARHLQPSLHLPTGVESTVTLLADAIATNGFVGLFEHGGARPGTPA